MNLPNKITVSRIFLIPVFLIFLLAPLPLGETEIAGTVLLNSQLIATAIFIFASVTDWIDGYIARKHNLVTNLGKFLDPLADKLLVTSAFVSLVELGAAPAWIVVVILSREFAVTGLRLVASSEGEVLAASNLGKLKTWIQIIAIIMLLIENVPFEAIGFPFATISLWAALIITVYSGWDYFSKNKEVLLKSR
ncbi:CDP-diacylglycerol--glycerol-3-phosphate 3-phosphatidyltransferase [Bacillus hwajinpoensis]|uniref:CDP-diacylglycerol--glycerol-3-phosphate 3-phosphatidyltransferase n=1 Tax=Guptibacillus hwajinpoensis TaxID=208199 RepID=A0A845EZ95_9BACL|nr:MULTISPECIES: CDP-diacylglycerol--glycerol-3-phosphate 3-phosphatidyltransferase [Bacillaceae]MYL63824.1 CDP-diacylglycerol--glycerol-3-phosphate 3-phosphatidyltransferase [Pseudalkalibacillus hwajinpoensis]PFG13008.1 CDP-diacylglycerol--glycerol-3-phosphate 3-phosphatidyltransferase [Bacillus sp. es.036]QHA91826.1 CDP-diacylglycerol--glycerol-3-phosphate 3-phosphatidyltransferase [Bacillus sp. N1-1]